MPKSVYSERYRRFREDLVAARKRAGLSQEELARRLGKPQSYVSKYENGERRLDVVEVAEIAEAMGMALTDLVSRV